MLALFQNAPAPSSRTADGGMQDGIDDFAGYPLEVIRSPRQLTHILRQAVQSRQPVTLNSSHLGSGGQSRLLEVAPDGRELIIRRLADEQRHASLLADGHFNLLLHHDDSPLLLSLTLSRLMTRNQHDCYVAPLPDAAVSAQMRYFRRVHLTAASPFSLRQVFPDHDRIEARIDDISEGGIGLALPHLPMRGIRRSELWRGAMIIGGHAAIGPLDLKVSYLRSELGGQRIGLAITQATEGQRQALRRLLLRLQTRPH